jgi:hypothetical protein
VFISEQKIRMNDMGVLHRDARWLPDRFTRDW